MQGFASPGSCEVSDALEVVRNADAGDHVAKIRGDGLAAGDDPDCLLLDAVLLLVDGRIGGDDLSGEGQIRLAQGLGGKGDGVGRVQPISSRTPNNEPSSLS